MADQTTKKGRWFRSSLNRRGARGVIQEAIDQIPSGTLLTSCLPLAGDLAVARPHVRAVLGLPVPVIEHWGPAASVAVLGEGDGARITYSGVAAALAEPSTEVRLFGKPEVHGKRRLAVALARGADVGQALARARQAAAAIEITIEP